MSVRSGSFAVSEDLQHAVKIERRCGQVFCLWQFEAATAKVQCCSLLPRGFSAELKVQAVLVASFVYANRAFAYGTTGSTGVMTEWPEFVKNPVLLPGGNI